MRAKQAQTYTRKDAHTRRHIQPHNQSPTSTPEGVLVRFYFDFSCTLQSTSVVRRIRSSPSNQLLPESSAPPFCSQAPPDPRENLFLA
eukprot:484036-Pleurochrysis_carterae.AAC.1